MGLVRRLLCRLGWHEEIPKFIPCYDEWGHLEYTYCGWCMRRSERILPMVWDLSEDGRTYYRRNARYPGEKDVKIIRHDADCVDPGCVGCA